MSLKNLFGTEKGSKKILSLSSYSQYLDDVESIGYIEEYIKDRKRVQSHLNFATASEFCIYGSLTEYYKAGINRIQNFYPYDGSLKEKLQWINESSEFDLHLLEVCLALLDH